MNRKDIDTLRKIHDGQARALDDERKSAKVVAGFLLFVLGCLVVAIALGG